MTVAVLPAAPASAGTAGIAVRLGGVQRHVSAEEIAAAVDRPAGSYLLRAPGTAAEPVAHPPALSVRKLVALAGGSPDALTFVSITRPNGTSAILEHADLADPPPFPEGPPIVWSDAGGVRFFRPLRGPEDANAADNIGVTSGDLTIRVHQGPLLTVRAFADRRSVRAREAVRFTAEVIDAATPRRALSFSWRFGDGASEDGRDVRHVFPAPGVYEAIVTVTGDDDSGGSSPPLRIRVGDPPKRDGETGGGAGDRRRSPAQGPVAGNQNADPPEPRATRSRAARASARAAHRSGAARAHAPARDPRSSPRKASRHGRPPRSMRAPVPGGPIVQGTLVRAQVIATRPASSGAAALLPVAREGADSGHRLGGAVGIGAALALFGLGIQRERRPARVRWRGEAS